MDKLKQFFQKQNLQTRLIFWFLTLSLLPLAWFYFISYEYAKKIIVHQAAENLQAIGQHETQLIKSYLDEKEKRILALAKGMTAKQTTKDLIQAIEKDGPNSEEYLKIDKQVRPILTFQAEVSGYKNLWLVDPEGKILFSLNPSDLIGANLLTDPYISQPLKEIFENTRNFLQSQISKFDYPDNVSPPALFMAAPVLEDHHLLGIVITQIDISYFNQLFNNYSGLEETGETLLVADVNQQLMTLSPLRFGTDRSTLQIIPKNTAFSHFIEEVLNGKREITTQLDYRNQKVLVAGRFLGAAFPWAIVVKMDMQEVLAPINQFKFFSFLMALTIASIVILTAINIAKNLTYPILTLIRKTRLMAAGDLSQRIDIPADDELGRLARSFNEMAIKLDDIVKHLDTMVAQRTQEIEHQNNKLEHTIEELQETQNRLINQEKLASLGALTAGIAHEIKNPLNFINNFAELAIQANQKIGEQFSKIESLVPKERIQEIQESWETLKLDIQKIYDHGKRADSIIHNMLQHSRGAPGQKSSIDINTLLDEYVSLSFHGMRATDASFNVKIEKNYDPNLPEIQAIPQDISRVFLNILNNAYYSVHQKKRESKDPNYTPIVRISTQQDINHNIVVKIWDNGKGISLDIFPKLFTPFFTTKPSGEGTGLGLSLSYNIVQNHHGTITANSDYGRYAEFVITLPIGTASK